MRTINTLKKPTLKINFSDFWPGFDKTNNFFFDILSKKYELEISEKPDIVFYSVYTNTHVKYNCTRVLFTGENVKPNFFECDFAFSFELDSNPRNYRLPLYALYGDVKNLINRKFDADAILKAKSKFCCFLVSNSNCEVRNQFFLDLSKHKCVDSGGKTLNNIGYVVDNKLSFIKDYKFVIAFENESHLGYTTEKIYEPFRTNCVPIYWGNPSVSYDFNTKSFINCHDFESFSDVIKHILLVDADDELYKKYLYEPVFENDELNEFVKTENILDRLEEIIDYHFNKKFKIRPLFRPFYFHAQKRIKFIRSKFLWIPNLPNRFKLLSFLKKNKVKN